MKFKIVVQIGDEIMEFCLEVVDGDGDAYGRCDITLNLGFRLPTCGV